MAQVWGRQGVNTADIFLVYKGNSHKIGGVWLQQVERNHLYIKADKTENLLDLQFDLLLHCCSTTYICLECFSKISWPLHCGVTLKCNLK